MLFVAFRNAIGLAFSCSAALQIALYLARFVLYRRRHEIQSRGTHSSTAPNADLDQRNRLLFEVLVFRSGIVAQVSVARQFHESLVDFEF